jgi:BioD-like phosphotransacetylase family protein
VPTCDAVVGGPSREGLDEEYIIRRQETLAAAFRDCMTEVQSVQETGQYRQNFFKEVIDLAQDVSYALVVVQCSS